MKYCNEKGKNSPSNHTESYRGYMLFTKLPVLSITYYERWVLFVSFSNDGDEINLFPGILAAETEFDVLISTKFF